MPKDLKGTPDSFGFPMDSVLIAKDSSLTRKEIPGRSVRVFPEDGDKVFRMDRPVGKKGRAIMPEANRDIFAEYERQQELVDKIAREDTTRGPAPHIKVEDIIDKMLRDIEANTVMVYNQDRTKPFPADTATEGILEYGPELLRLLARGVNLQVASRAVGLLPATAYAWLSRGAPRRGETIEFQSKRPERAARFALYIACSRIWAYNEAYAVGTIYTGIVRGDREDSKWWLERVWPERYAKKTGSEEEGNFGELARIVGIAMDNMRKPQNALPLPEKSLKVVDAEFRAVEPGGEYLEEEGVL